MEKIRASLFNSSDLIGLSSLEGEEGLMEITTEEILTASSVNQSLFDTQGSSALEDYFLDKTIRGWNYYVLLKSYYLRIISKYNQGGLMVLIAYSGTQREYKN